MLLQLLCLTCLCLSSAKQVSYPGSGIRFTDQTYRKYTGKRDPEHPWTNTVDVLSKRGYHMVPVLGEPTDQEVTIINTDLGAVGLSGQPNYILQDFHTAYGIPTIWPYCESVNKCLVYSQPTAPAYKSPTVLCFPPGTSAVDFYIDAAIDCVKTLHAVVSCRAVVQPGNIDVKFRVKSICESPKVGKYIGFFDEEGEDIESVTIKCKSTYPNALGLIRIGSKQQPSLKQQGVTAARESATVEATV